MPTHTDDSIKIFDWIKNNLGNKVFISLMNQYIPCFKAKNFKEINNKIKPLEYKRVVIAVQNMGFENGFIQDKSSSCREFIPEFDLEKFIEIY